MRLAVCGAAALAVLTMACEAPAAGAARPADCWLLDEAALARAQAQGGCHDVFARGAPQQAKPARARTAKPARRAASKAAPSPWASLERLMGRIKPDAGSTGQSRYGGIDHLAYGRPDRTPVQR
ncbi:hypothetical protein [Azospirillum sp. sgz301742]